MADFDPYLGFHYLIVNPSQTLSGVVLSPDFVRVDYFRFGS